LVCELRVIKSRIINEFDELLNEFDELLNEFDELLLRRVELG
jgi:hypothetical protein